MYDPINKDRNEDEENDEDPGLGEDVIIAENEATEALKDIVETETLEKAKIKYGAEMKFHYLITSSGELGKALPCIMKMDIVYPGEPKFL